MITEKNSHSNHLIIVIDVISRYRFFFFGGGEIIMFILFDIKFPICTKVL